MLPGVSMRPAYAKINLTLEILRRRADGYHDLASIMQTIALHDTIAFHPAAESSHTLVCDAPELEGESNLALRAAHALARAHAASMDAGGASALARGVRLELRKAVPVQAGLGGGSSDAACVLLALAARWELDLPPEQLLALAAALGSDVPYFLSGGTALVRGRGEQVAQLPDADAFWIVLARPPVAIATPAAYAALTPADFGDGSASMAVADAIQRTGQVPFARLVNGFEASVYRNHPEVARLREALAAAGAPVVRLSGSGPTLFAPFASLAAAAEVYARLRAGGHEVWLTSTISRAAFRCAAAQTPAAM